MLETTTGRAWGLVWVKTREEQTEFTLNIALGLALSSLKLLTGSS